MLTEGLLFADLCTFYKGVNIVRELSGVKGLVPRPHGYEISYTITMDGKGPFLYRILGAVSKESVERGIKDYLGSDNIERLRVEFIDRHETVVSLLLKSDTISHKTYMMSRSPRLIEGEIRRYLDGEHVFSIKVDHVKDLGGFGPHR